MYLFLRFQIKNELETMNFMDNKNWFYNKVYSNVKENGTHVKIQINNVLLHS